jgi:hypothetical protein
MYVLDEVHLQDDSDSGRSKNLKMLHFQPFNILKFTSGDD